MSAAGQFTPSEAEIAAAVKAMAHAIDAYWEIGGPTLELQARVALEAAASARAEVAIEEQRRSFAFGNVNLANPAVTRELVDRVADELARGGKP